MRIEQLAYIIQIAQYKSLSEASEHLNMTQQALNASIHKMEDEVGVRLLSRTHKGTQLTKEGQVFVKGANKLLVDYYNLLNQIKSEDNHFSEKVNIGVSFGLLEAFFSNILAQYYKEDSSIQLNVVELTQQHLLEELLSNTIQFGVVSFNSYEEPSFLKNDHYSFYPLFRSKLYVRVSKKSPLAQYDTISLKTAIKEQIIVYQPKYWENYVNPLCELLEHFHPDCKLIYENNYQMHYQKIVQGLGISFTIIDKNSSDRETPGLKLIPLKDDVVTTIGCLIPQKVPAPSVQYLLNYFRILCVNKQVE